MKIGAVSLGDRPCIAVCFGDDVRPADVAAARNGGADLVEARIDQFRSFAVPDVKANLAVLRAQLPVLATIRIRAEGGRWDGSEEERRRLYEAVLPEVDAIDIELQSRETLAAVVPLAKQAGKPIVVSFHDFKATPDHASLLKIVQDAQGAGADIVKIATFIKSRDDLRSLTRLLAEAPDRQLVVIGMGELGLASRLFFPALGSLISFAGHGEQQSAPGQLPYTEMVELFRRIYPR